MYSSAEFTAFSSLYKRHDHPFPERFHLPGLPPSLPAPSLPSSCRHQPPLHFLSLGIPGTPNTQAHTIFILLHLAYFGWYNVSKGASRLRHVSELFSFLRLNNSPPGAAIFSVRWPMVGRLGCFSPLSLGNSAAMNASVPVLFTARLSPFCRVSTGIGIAGSRGSSMFNFPLNHYTVFHSA